MRERDRLLQAIVVQKVERGKEQMYGATSHSHDCINTKWTIILTFAFLISHNSPVSHQVAVTKAMIKPVGNKAMRHAVAETVHFVFSSKKYIEDMFGVGLGEKRIFFLMEMHSLLQSQPHQHFWYCLCFQNNLKNWTLLYKPDSWKCSVMFGQ